MKLKQVFKLSFAVLFVFILSSCNSDSSDYTQDSYSKDAQIYGFKLTCKPITSADSVNYPIMAGTKFAIDQFRDLIYNPDSLPYKTTLKKFLATVSFGTYGIGKIQLLYPNDSVASWEDTTDSIDFSTPSYPKFLVTAPDGVTSKTYTIDIRVHKVNPDLLIWEDVTSKLNQPTSIVNQKTLLKEGSTVAKVDTFFTFSKDNDNQLYLHKAVRDAAYSYKQAITGLSTANVNLDNIILFNGGFYVVGENKKGYSSEDGVRWTEKASGIYGILGVLPAANAAKDSLLVITENGGKYSFSKTSDLNELKLVREFNGLEMESFPISGFSAITNFDRTDLNKNLLILTGGENVGGKYGRLTWLVQVSNNNVLRTTSDGDHSVFPNTPGIVNFMYDDYLYALIANKLYKSASFGYKWIPAPTTEALVAGIPRASGQSIIVDRENYIWIFGGVSTTSSDSSIHQVWRGRLNKLNPKR
ncbi:MAG: DUF6242 domain-containing protein [Dysgonomonas sp.]